MVFPIREWSPLDSTLVCTGKEAAPDAVEFDDLLATRTIQTLQHVKQAKQNFFIAVGFRRPHVDWRVPYRFWDMYEGETIDVAKHQTIGRNVTILEYEGNSEIQEVNFTKGGQRFSAGPQTPLPAELQRSLRRAYYASVSFLDFEVGRVLGAVDDLGLASTTGVLFHADHGWKLGEHGDWSKCSIWETDARVPLIIRAPWVVAPAGQRTGHIAELIDIFPTLVDLAGLPPADEPAAPLDGRSLVPALRRPACAGCWAGAAAFTQFPRCTQFSLRDDPIGWQCIFVARENFTRMGYSVRVADARYTEWRAWLGAELAADWTPAGLVAAELYDHTGDPGVGPAAYDEYEADNLAYEPAHRARAAALAATLRAQFGPAARAAV